ncbi:hypothetical protein TNCV_3650421 [Trichonephila clavipes]|uniref:Uncharacterized protein n=1 Tax=Trichonephila clavipes TaxID=2585209 RepID=A0A8X6VIS6_TRICX|nr:hypothetical protein TNCV_3650421 [Trichonephila clavipes]
MRTLPSTVPHINIVPISGAIRYQIHKLGGCVGGTETTQNYIGIQGRKCQSCELRRKEAEEKDRNSNTLMRQKTFYWKIVLQQACGSWSGTEGFVNSDPTESRHFPLSINPHVAASVNSCHMFVAWLKKRLSIPELTGSFCCTRRPFLSTENLIARIHVAAENILTYQKFIDQMSSMCLALLSIKIKLDQTAPVKRQLYGSKASSLLLTAVTVLHSKTWRCVRPSKVTPVKTIKPPLL